MRPAYTYRQSRRNEWRQDRELAWPVFLYNTYKPQIRSVFNPSRIYNRKGKR